MSQLSRRGKNLHRSSSINVMTALMLFGLWISNTILGYHALPRPKAANNDEFRPNFAAMYGAPLITPIMEDVTLEVNTNYTLRCESNDEIVWKLPIMFVTHSTENFATQDPEHPYGSLLYLRDVQKENVGSYYCIKQNSLEKEIEEMEEEEFEEMVNNNLAASIYIYVNDEDNLLVPFEYPVGYAYQYQDFTIPCKPTVPNVEVLLTTPIGDTHSSEKSGRYDPKRGFVVQIGAVTDGGMYMCRPKVPSQKNEEEETSFEIEFRGNQYIDLTTTKLTTDMKLAKTTTTTTDATTPTVKDTTTKTTTTKFIRSVTGITYQKSILTKLVNVPNTNRIVEDVDVNVGVVSIKNCNRTNAKIANNNEITTDIVDKVVDDADVDSFVISTMAATTTPPIESYHTLASTNGFGLTTNGVGIINVDVLRSLGKRDVNTTPSSRRRTHNSSHSTTVRNTPRSHTTHVNKPTITSESRGHAYVGDTFQLVCIVRIAHDVTYVTEWNLPSGMDESRVEKQNATFLNKTETHTYGRAILTIHNAKKSDTGNYKCTVTDHSNNKAHNYYLMTILNQNESYIDMKEPNDYYIIKEKAGKTITISVKYRGHPPATITWLRPDRTEIQPTHKFNITTTDTTSMLKILDAQMTDSGDYVVKAENGFERKERIFNVSISDAPIVTVNDVYLQEGEQAHLECRVLSYPTANVTWVFRPCKIQPRWPSCDNKIEQRFDEYVDNPVRGETSIEQIHSFDFTPTVPGIAHCIATNKINRIDGKSHVLIGDIPQNISILGVDERQIIARGDEIVITCAALAYHYAEDLEWFKDNDLLLANDNLEITKSQSDYSYRKTLKFKSIRDEDVGNYECRAKNANNPEDMENKFIYINVQEPYPPRTPDTNLDSKSTITRKLGNSLELKCSAHAIPPAHVTWYKDDTVLKATDNLAITDNETKLFIPFLKPEDEGTYKCIMANRLGTIEHSAQVKITNLPGLKLGWIVGIVFFFIVLIALVIYLCVRVNRERKLLRELKAAGLANFEEGAVEHINPALTLDEQADLLPYDRRFEFPRHKLKLGKQLGAGAFGVVLKAHAEGIKADEKESVVAVKMVKRTADNEVMKALVSELKIMVHLGQHLNVVNLLGAVTENIAKREVMVIVEYCRYGNVQNFLLRNRKRFIDQINPETDKIDSTIVTQRFSDNFELNRNSNSDNDPRSGTRAGRPNSSGYLRQSDLYEGQVDSCATEQTVMTTIPEGEDTILSNNSVQPAWRSNYKTDSTEAMTITTSDLVSWAFQVARGMDYLSSRKVLHGDLAARNILLCEDNVVKICDFGLARSMYKSENYKKQGEAPLPIKWLALESLSDHVFSTYTDVWSFGIVLWEFFSLAKVPYPGMDPNQSLYMKLKDGYRMEKPPFANYDLYDIMLECWSTNPERRPLFHVLEQKFAKMLEDDVTNHYLELNTTYLQANNEYFKRNETDYLALMGSPDEAAPAPPRYVNGHILPEIRIDNSSDDYVQMSTQSGTAIFSPTRPKDFDTTIDNSTTTTSFTFPDTATQQQQQHSPTLANNLDSPTNKSRKKEDIQPEEIPMLHKTQDSDGDSSSSPEQARKYNKTETTPKHSRVGPTPSPRHHVAETTLTDLDEKYVNLKSPKKLANNSSARASPDAYSNPSYHMLKTVNEGAK